MKSELAKFGGLVTPAEGERWITQDGESLLISEMETTHIFYSVRMLWNHHVPVVYRLMPYRPYSIKWSEERVVGRMIALLNELQSRGWDVIEVDLSDSQVDDLVYMLTCRKSVIGSRGFTPRIESHEG